METKSQTINAEFEELKDLGKEKDPTKESIAAKVSKPFTTIGGFIWGGVNKTVNGVGNFLGKHNESIKFFCRQFINWFLAGYMTTFGLLIASTLEPILIFAGILFIYCGLHFAVEAIEDGIEYLSTTWTKIMLRSKKANTAEERNAELKSALHPLGTKA